MFSRYIRRNNKRSYRENGIFFLSLIVAIIAFYVVLSLEQQDVMVFLKKMESDAVNKLLNLIPAVYVFSLFLIFFLIYFATKYQLERRNHEFGMLMMLGMKRSRLFKGLLIEDIYSSTAALVVGLPIAVLLSELISLTTARLIGAGVIGHRFSLSLKGILFTVIGFVGIKLFANILLSARIVKTEPGRLMNDVCEGKQKQMKPKHSFFSLFLGIVFLCLAYALAISKRTWQGIAAFSVTMIFGISGTFLVIKGICALFSALAQKQKPREKLQKFTFRQLQENVFLCSNSLAVSSLFVLIAVACMAFGISTSVFELKESERHSIDFTFEAYDENTNQSMEELSQQQEIRKNIDSWSKVRVSYLAANDIWRADETFVEYDTSDMERVISTLPKEAQEYFSMIYYQEAPHVIALSGFNEILEKCGKERIHLDEKEVALFRDSEFYSVEDEKMFSMLLEQHPQIKIDGNAYQLKEKVYSEDIVVDRSITMSFALIVSDEDFERYAMKNNISIYWNAYLSSELVEKVGLMQAVSQTDEVLRKSGMEYESYLQNMGRQLFYIVASSYLTIYLAVIFLIIANTTIGLQFLMQEKKTRKRYRTLICLGSNYDDICKSSSRQIKWYFQIPIGVAAVSSIFGVSSLFSGILPSVLEEEKGVLLVIAATIIAILCVMEYSYMKMVMHISRRSIMQMIRE